MLRVNLISVGVRYCKYFGRMENSLEQIMDEIFTQPDVCGCLFSNEQGLGLAARGKASINSSGNVTAIAKLASQLEPGNSTNPIIKYENDSKSCIIKRYGTVTGAILKKNIN